MEFGTGSGYFSPMDREYGQPQVKSSPTNDVGVGIKDIGFSTGLGPVPNLQALSAKMRVGQKKMELSFMGMGKGSQQGQTPGMFGERQRQAFREMQAANEYNFTTHSSVGVMGLAGMDQQGNFSRQNQKRAIDEIKRAIDFAADVARGGPVVVHTGEYFRHMSDAPWNSEGKYQDKFSMFEGEKERASFRVVDSRTGQIIAEARKNKNVARPVWHMATAGQEYIDPSGNTRTVPEGEKIYIDYENHQVKAEERLPEFDSAARAFKTRQMTWEDFKEEAKDMTIRAKRMWREWKDGKIKEEDFDKSYWGRFRDAKSEDEVRIRPEEAYIIGTLETNAANSRGWAAFYGNDYDRLVERLKKLKGAKAFYEKIEHATSEEEKWKLKKQMGDEYGGLIPPDSKYPSEIIDQAIRDLQGRMSQQQEAGSSQLSQANETVETIRHVESADTFALKESYTAYATAGIKAMMNSQKLEQEGKLKRPLAISMENIFPESYGAHPDELIELVQNSRKKMTEMLTQQGMRESDAAKKAEQHISATFDTAHCNLWWKYWKGDQKKTMEENRKEFETWMLDRVEEMAKKKIIGHLHLVDNYGYEDEHLAPGQGNTPVKKIVEIFKKNGFKGDLIVEPGADFSVDSSGSQTLLKAWQHFGSPIYGMGGGGGGGGRGWNQVGYEYMGMNQPPYFVFGGYSPSEDWTLWSGVPLE